MPNSQLIVETTEDRRKGLVSKLIKVYGVPAVAGSLPLDFAWTAQKLPVMGDSKTPSDLIASAKDGRLHEQMQVATDAGGLAFIFLIGEWSIDGGWTVGQREHSWTWDAFDDLLVSLQCEGVKIIHVPNEEAVPRRLATFYRWTERENHGSWHRSPVLLPPAYDYADEDFRSKVGLVMHLPGCGPTKAEALLRRYGLATTLGISVDELDRATERWLAVKGIGPKLVSKWREYLLGE